MQLLSQLSDLLPWLPAAVSGFFFWALEHQIKKKEAQREKREDERQEEQKKREKLREKQELFLMQGMGAAIALGEATAKAVQRIPDAHCNGDMHAALNYAQKIKNEQRDFIAQQGIESLYD